jgi:hypothetical protein
MSRKALALAILLAIMSANPAVYSAEKIVGKDLYTKSEREKAAADGRKKKAATKTYVDTIYPKSGLSGLGEPWTIPLGAIVGYALETDTTVYIDGKYVKSYAVGNMNAVAIEDLIPFGFTIKRDPKNKLITITRDAKAVKKEYGDQVDKSNVLAGRTAYTLVANNVRVKTMDKRAYPLTLSPSMPSFTTTTGKTLVPVEFFHIVTSNFSKQGNLAFVSYPANKKEIRLHTLENDEVYYATGPMRRYWVADKYPDTEKSLLDGDERKVLAKAQSILKEIITPGMGEFEKELAIYDYLATYGAYDYSSYAENNGRLADPEDPPANPEAYNVYGALVDALAVCEGWSDAYQLLFTLVGMKSETPIGSLSENLINGFPFKSTANGTTSKRRRNRNRNLLRCTIPRLILRIGMQMLILAIPAGMSGRFRENTTI